MYFSLSLQYMDFYSMFRKLIFLSIIICWGNIAFSQVNQQKIPDKTRILFLLDASGSMLGRWENTYRIAAAKQLLSDLVDSLRTNQNLQLALRVYGHQYHRKFQNCEDTKLEVPFAERNHDQIKNRLLNIKPQGTTPIAFSLQQAANDFPKDQSARNVIIIITDGIESCDGDPCAVSLALQRQNIFLKPFIIGLGMDKNYEEQFKCVGDFFDANNIQGFKNALSSVIKQSLERATVSVELLDINNQPTETNLNVTFINTFTQDAQYEFVHYLDDRGRPDSVEVDPVLNYDLLVNSIPTVKLTNVAIEGGKHNVIRVKSPQGFLNINQKGHTEYENGVKVLLKKHNEDKVIHAMNVPQTEKILVGSYDLDILTLPRIYLNNIKIEQSQTNTINIPSPGVVNISTSYQGYGSVYQLLQNGGQRWVINLDEKETKTTLAMQPGQYKVVFRSKNSKGSKFTQIKKFRLSSGDTQNINFSF